MQHKGYLLLFVTASFVTALFFSAIPRLTGLAFDEVLQPDASVRRLGLLALFILGLVIVRGITDIINAFSIEVLAQRLERDAREELMAVGGHYAELYNTYFRHQSPDYDPELVMGI